MTEKSKAVNRERFTTARGIEEGRVLCARLRAALDARDAAIEGERAGHRAAIGAYNAETAAIDARFYPRIDAALDAGDLAAAERLECDHATALAPARARYTAAMAPLRATASAACGALDCAIVEIRTAMRSLGLSDAEIDRRIGGAQ